MQQKDISEECKQQQHMKTQPIRWCLARSNILVTIFLSPLASILSYLLLGWLHIYGVQTRLFCCALTDKRYPNEVKLIGNFSSLYSRKVTHSLPHRPTKIPAGKLETLIYFGIDIMKEYFFFLWTNTLEPSAEEKQNLWKTEVHI